MLDDWMNLKHPASDIKHRAQTDKNVLHEQRVNY